MSAGSRRRGRSSGAAPSGRRSSTSEGGPREGQRSKLGWIDCVFEADGNGFMVEYTVEEDDVLRVQCLLCSEQLRWIKSGRTPLIRHALKHLRENRNGIESHMGAAKFGQLLQWASANSGSEFDDVSDLTQVPTQLTLAQTTGKWGEGTSNRKKFTRLVTNYIVSSGSAFRIVENAHFRALCRFLHKKAPPLSAKRVSRHISSDAEQIRMHIRSADLAQFRPCLVADGWSQAHKHWLAVGICYIEPQHWKLIRVSLGTWECPGNATAVTLKELLFKIRTVYGLAHYRPSIVTDHEARIGAACERGSEYDWHGCSTHRINLGVKGALDNASDRIKTLLTSVHKTCTAIMGRATYWEKFKEIQKELLDQPVHAIADQRLNLVNESQTEGCLPEDVSQAASNPFADGAAVNDPGCIDLDAVDDEGGAADPGSDLEELEDTTGPIISSDKILRLTLRNDTRWNSVWYMLHRFLRLSRALKRMQAELPYTDCFPDEDWPELREIYDVLEPYKDATKLFEAEENITCSMVLQVMSRCSGIVDLLPIRSESVQQFRAEIRVGMDAQFDDAYWFHALGCQLQLDPTRIPITAHEIGQWVWESANFWKVREEWPTQDDWVRAIHTECSKLVDEISKRHPTTEPPPDQITAPSGPARSRRSDYLLATAPVGMEGGDEYSRYRSARSFSHYGTDVCTWWRTHKTKFPNVATLAAEYLCIPASSAMIERSFSVTGHHLNKRRRLMAEDRVTDLTLVRDNLHLIK